MNGHNTSNVNSRTTMLEARNIGHAFGGLKVLRNVNFKVNKGSITGLIGPNGSGKTTCFNILSGFLRANSGSVLYMSEDITQVSIQKRSRLGVVRTFQTPQLFNHLTVLENLMTGCYKRSGSHPFADMFRTSGALIEWRQMEDWSVEAAQRFGLTHLLDRKAGTLPAGQMRMVELARACVGQPQLLLLDEPSSGLSSAEIDTLRNWILTLNGDGMSILLVSHDMGLMSIAHEVNVLYFGEILATGSMDQIQNDKRVRDAYLGA